MKEISGGVTAAKGFKAAGIHVGVKSKNVNKKDLALIVSDVECTAPDTRPSALFNFTIIIPK